MKLCGMRPPVVRRAPFPPSPLEPVHRHLLNPQGDFASVLCSADASPLGSPSIHRRSHRHRPPKSETLIGPAPIGFRHRSPWRQPIFTVRRKLKNLPQTGCRRKDRRTAATRAAGLQIIGPDIVTDSRPPPFMKDARFASFFRLDGPHRRGQRYDTQRGLRQ